METGFYDIHTHILPGVDDGSKSPEESKQMLQMAYDQGVRHIVATPHFSVNGKNHPVEELQDKLKLLRQMAAEIDPSFKWSGDHRRAEERTSINHGGDALYFGGIFAIR